MIKHHESAIIVHKFDGKCSAPSRLNYDAVIKVAGSGIRTHSQVARMHPSVTVPTQESVSGESTDESLVWTVSKHNFVVEVLKENRKRSRILSDRVTDHAIFMMSIEGRIWSWIPGAERTEGYKADEFIDRHSFCVIPSEKVARRRLGEILLIAAPNRRYEEQGTRARKNASRFLASITFTALLDRAAQPRGFSQ